MISGATNLVNHSQTLPPFSPLCWSATRACRSTSLYALILWDVNTQPRPSTLQWRHNERDGLSYNQPHDCLLNRLFRRRSKETSKLRVPGLCGGNSPVTGEFPAQMASNAGNISIWWRHHDIRQCSWTDVRTWVPFKFGFLYDTI